MKKLSVLCLTLLLCIGMLAGCTSEETPVLSDSNSSQTSLPPPSRRCYRKKAMMVHQKRLRSNLAISLPVHQPCI